MEQIDVLSTDRVLRPLDLADEDWSAREKRRTYALRYFDFVVALSQFFGFLALILSGYYFSIIDHGYQWGAKGANVTDDGPQPRNGFGNVNFHGLFMTVALVFFQGEALLSYRVYRHEPRLMAKWVHAAFHFSAVVLVVFAMIAIVNHKNLGPVQLKHMYSIHSWLGVGILSIYVVQLCIGFLAFFFPKVSQDLRRRFLPVQRTIGLTTFVASLAQVVLGNQTYSWQIMTWGAQILGYKKYGECAMRLDCPQHPYLVQNFAMLAVVFYGISVIVLLVNPKWRRDPTPDEKEA
uniref:Cytochrome b561 domain-containing protein n=1 Tax=Steinernema glaseri TaxID=37863 RepID=A0A1I7ZHI6_9BILA